jgi:pyruvate formate lyase activating enzyme
MICPICEQEKIVAGNLRVCNDCIRADRNSILRTIAENHAASRREFGLPAAVPKNSGRTCTGCGNACAIPEGETGYCGLRENRSGSLVTRAGSPSRGFADWYFDPLPTNCVADWVCDGSKQEGHKNLAVFYRSCSFNCLFCQNWHFKKEGIAQSGRKLKSARSLASMADSRTFCICYFGGDPGTQLSHALAASRHALKKKQDIRICLETNGNLNKKTLDTVLGMCFRSGGCIKFDLKAFNENLHLALCGINNRTTLENFKKAVQFGRKRKRAPLVIASTLLVPGYIDEEEVHSIAKFISSLDRTVPYSLLGFHPNFYLHDLLVTSKAQAHRCYEAACDAGLERVHIGNTHLLV